ncbi:MAG: cysteine--tRNA ligase [Candidatus Yanofskybacteria bacterium RIFCSPHIGHO2_01_FULL_39_8b]|uniref:Cysteine--tRNA ligase n=1 Tax=Candidatus Yanofskybacteria bacterium RIFCSPHIGHO2_01_FULL_39_8b TaxID=1802659 RepID=A0A1F8E8X2_9BACT|nr:MAG: cysteine--tRNA ligase [Candidatus Yanofskybacteria bacterium RIFCSPHIGHO2_01_FULL_39_8b]
MKIYNTLTKTKEPLVSCNDKKIQMFVCGPTVYDYIHIGNARTFVFFDVVAKYLKSQDYEIDYIQNITDIDDKIINKAKQENKPWKEVADFYFDEFKKDIETLGVTSPRYIKATDHIEDVRKQVKILIKNKNIYLLENDGWYFNLKTFPEYGKLSGRNAEIAETDDAVSRIDESEGKRNNGDFCVWKLAKVGENWWNDEKLGNGRPGWHIEDTAITEHFFGPQYDIHGGGQDLIFPHHEAEITQQESASGKKPFVKYWMHVAFLINKEQKMSKSLGNFETVNELLKKYPKEVLRFYLLSGHYRQPLEFSDKMLKQSGAAINRITEFIQKLELAKSDLEVELPSEILELVKKQFTEAMDNDFNTPEAFAAIFEMIRAINPLLSENKVNQGQAKEILKLFKEIDTIANIVPSEKQKIPTEIQELVEKREKLRQGKNYEKADKIRTQIFDLGYGIEDTIYGPLTLKND